MHEQRGARADEELARAMEMHPRLVARLASYCGDWVVAEEIAQDTLLAACRQGPALEQIDRLWGWLWRVAVNATHSHYRRAWRETAMEATDRAGDGDLAEEVAVRLLLTELDGRERAALWLRLFEQHSVVETAELLGCPPGTVKSLTSRGAARLRGRLAA